MTYDPLRYVPDYSGFAKAKTQMANAIAKIPELIELKNDKAKMIETHKGVRDEAVARLTDSGYGLPEAEQIVNRSFYPPTGREFENPDKYYVRMKSAYDKNITTKIESKKTKAQDKELVQDVSTIAQGREGVSKESPVSVGAPTLGIESKPMVAQVGGAAAATNTSQVGQRLGASGDYSSKQIKTGMEMSGLPTQRQEQTSANLEKYRSASLDQRSATEAGRMSRAELKAKNDQYKTAIQAKRFQNKEAGDLLNDMKTTEAIMSGAAKLLEKAESDVKFAKKMNMDPTYSETELAELKSDAATAAAIFTHIQNIYGKKSGVDMDALKDESNKTSAAQPTNSLSLIPPTR